MLAVQPRAAARRPGTLSAALALLLFLVAVVLASPAGAHVDLVATTPENLARPTEPVREVRLEFSGAADPVASAFGIRGPDGPVAIRTVRNAGERTVVVRPDRPLTEGRHRVTWGLRGPDGHVMRGALAFTPTAAAAGPVDAPPLAAPPEVADPAPSPAVPVVEAGAAPMSERVSTWVWWSVTLAALAAAGGVGYLRWVHRGRAAEGRWLGFLVRRAAAATVLLAVVAWGTELVVTSGDGLIGLLSPTAWSDLIGSTFSTATLLRLVGGALVLAGVGMGLRNDPDPDGAPGAPARAEVPVGGVGTLTVPRTERSGLRLVVTPAALAGAVALVASESFVGHTVSEGNRGIMAISDGVHVGAAALWSAGTALLAATLWRRRRRGEPRDAKLVAARFSVVATYALAAVAVSGTVLAVSILGGIGGVLSTDFGRMLLLKLALVAPIVGIGWWNHRVVVPAIARGDRAAADRLRITATVEVALFIAVVAATALLVGADPTT
ncbi:MAG: hypothetical protein RL531_1407 [Actinomycetota bacterium]